MIFSMKVGEVEAMLDLLIAVEKKGQWQGKLEKDKSVHAEFFPEGIKKTIEALSAALPLNTEEVE